MIEQITWLIWRALHTPPPDLSQRLQAMHDIVEQPTSRHQIRRHHILAVVLFLIIGALLVWWIMSVDWLTTVLSSGLVLILGLVTCLILASATMSGARWAFQIAAVIYHDIHEGRYDLLSLSPLGVLGALWVISRRQSKISRVVEFFQTVGLALFLAMLLVGVVFIYVLLQGPPIIFLSQPILGSVFIIGLVIFIFFIDYVQAVVIGHLSGIYVGSIAASLTLAGASAVGVLIAIQIAAYAMAGLVAFLIAVLSTFIFRETGDATLLLVTLAFVGTAYGFREYVIRVLWRTILTRFAVTNVEFSEFREHIP